MTPSAPPPPPVAPVVARPPLSWNRNDTPSGCAPPRPPPALDHVDRRRGDGGGERAPAHARISWVRLPSRPESLARKLERLERLTAEVRRVVVDRGARERPSGDHREEPTPSGDPEAPSTSFRAFPERPDPESARSESPSAARARGRRSPSAETRKPPPAPERSEGRGGGRRASSHAPRKMTAEKARVERELESARRAEATRARPEASTEAEETAAESLAAPRRLRRRRRLARRPPARARRRWRARRRKKRARRRPSTNARERVSPRRARRNASRRPPPPPPRSPRRLPWRPPPAPPPPAPSLVARRSSPPPASPTTARPPTRVDGRPPPPPRRLPPRSRPGPTNPRPPGGFVASSTTTRPTFPPGRSARLAWARARRFASARGRRASRRRRGRCRGTTRGEHIRARDRVRTRRLVAPRGASPRVEIDASTRGRSPARASTSTRRRVSFPFPNQLDLDLVEGERARPAGVGAREGVVFFRRRRRDALAWGGIGRVRRAHGRGEVATAPRDSDEREGTSRQTPILRARTRRVGVGPIRRGGDERVAVDAGATSRRRVGEDSRGVGLALARGGGGVVARDSTGGGGTPRVG